MTRRPMLSPRAGATAPSMAIAPTRWPVHQAQAGVPGPRRPLHALAAPLAALLLVAGAGCAAPTGGKPAAAAPARSPDEPPPSGLPAPSGKLDAGLAVLDRAESLYDREQWSAARSEFGQLVAQFPRNAYFWFRRGNCDARLGNFEAAAQAYQTAIGLDESDGRFSYNLGLVRLAQARAALDHAQRRLDGNDLLKLEAQRLFEGIQPRYDNPVAQAEPARRPAAGRGAAAGIDPAAAAAAPAR